MNVRKWGITVVSCGLVFAALTVFKVMEIRGAIAAAEAYPEQSATVEPAEVASAQYIPTITVIGELVAPQRLDLRNELAGEITAVNFTSGAKVSKDQILVQLDTLVEQANLEAAAAKAKLAKQVYDRIEGLFKTGATNQDQLDRARADLTSANAEIEVLKRTIAKKTLRAPFDGRAGLHTFEVGQYLESNTLITTLIGDKDFIWVDFRVPQFYRQLSTDMAVDVAVISNANSNTNTSNSSVETAYILAENTVLNANNRSRSYRAKMDNANEQFAANTMVEVQVPVGDAEMLLQVPATAVQNDPLGQFVFTLTQATDGIGYRAARERVQVKTVNNNVAFLEKGSELKNGDLIAGAGAFKLYEGILVFVQERQAQALGEDAR